MMMMMMMAVFSYYQGTKPRQKVWSGNQALSARIETAIGQHLYDSTNNAETGVKGCVGEAKRDTQTQREREMMMMMTVLSYYQGTKPRRNKTATAKKNSERAHPCTSDDLG